MNQNHDGLKWLHASSIVKQQYDADLLQPISRDQSRRALKLDAFWGCDIWWAYEVSFLTPSGYPQVATMRFSLDACSPNVVESKSLKLYLNALNNKIFDNHEHLYQVIKKDLAVVIGMDVELNIAFPPFANKINVLPLASWQLLDDINSKYTVNYDQPAPNVLKIAGDEIKDEKLYSYLFRSNCLVTNQPDWATIMIQYNGQSWDKAALLAYLVSFRNHQGFHEQCIDRIFSDISEHLKPNKLFVQANFTRRGGIDITPIRANYPDYKVITGRDWRQ
tara:strand:+ start:883 stop:1713 length:831 start_codon:yes stop_codon:yes gene_type:complete